MVDEIENQGTTEVVEQLEEHNIDLEVVHWAAGESEPNAGQKKWFEKLRSDRGNGFYSDLIFALLGRRYSRSEARFLWGNILSHRDVLVRSLGRNPGVVVAALDWLTNMQQDNKLELSLIECSKLENILERAVIDGLTRLYDHDTFLALLGKEIDRAGRHSEKVSLLLLDLDDFKLVNDEFGHQKGDQVLIRLADIIRENMRAMDIAGRYGGEEFVIILPETDLTSAVQSAERLRNAVESGFASDVGLTISVGIACFPENGRDAATLISRADESLYLAKAHGKNRVQTSQ